MSKIHRESWVDVAKGILIFLVVFGHTVFVDPAATEKYFIKFVYWFHMPAFFILSGYLFKPLTGWHELPQWILRRTKRLLVPYASFVIVVTLYRYCQDYTAIQNPAQWITYNLVTIAAGGQSIKGLYSPFWFITCLFFTQVLFAVLTLFSPSNLTRFSVVALAYLAAHLESWFYPELKVFWNADVALIGLTYYSFGFFARPFLSSGKIPFSLVIASILVLFLKTLGLFSYNLDLKYHIYNNLVMDLLIPVLFTATVLMVSREFAVTRAGGVLSLIGKASLPIMYLHIMVNDIAGQFFHYGITLFTLIGIAIPVVLTSFLQRYQLTKSLFLGIPSLKAPQAGHLQAGANISKHYY